MRIIVTVLSVWMALLWSSILFLLFYFLRKMLRFSEVFSISGIVVIYLFCMIRLFVPAEFPPWTKVVDGGKFYRILGDIYLKELFSAGIKVGQLLTGVWIIGALFFLYRIFYEYIKTSRYYNGLPKITVGREYVILSEVFLDNRKRPLLSKSNIVCIPCCIGIIKKHILLPDKQYSDEELKYIFMHECSHAKNNDVLIRLLINILCAVYWWNPLVYLLRKDLNQSMEIRCDENVINDFDDEEKRNYLNVMLSIFKEYTDIPTENMRNAVVPFMESYPDRMVERFELVARHKNRKYPYANIIATWLIAACVLVLSYKFIIQPRYDAPIEWIETSENAHAVYRSNSYILETNDNEYYFCSEYETIMITKESVDGLIAAGFELKKEDK